MKKAKNLGANISLKFKKNKIKKFNRKFNKVFITTGSKIAIENAILCAADKSDIYFVGVPNPNDKISIKPFEIHNGKKFHPSSGGGIIPNRDIPIYIKKLKHQSKILKNFIINETSINKASNIILSMSKGKLNYGRNLIKF